MMMDAVFAADAEIGSDAVFAADAEIGSDTVFGADAEIAATQFSLPMQKSQRCSYC